MLRQAGWKSPEELQDAAQTQVPNTAANSNTSVAEKK
jgi:hypothetical protein